jgi:hypothetical protein
MKKIIIAELNKLKSKKLISERELRMYALDWDDNILRMPTKIYLKTDDGAVIGMSTDDFAEYRHLIGKEPFQYQGKSVVNFDNDAFRDFTHPETFLQDAEKAIRANRTSPSFDKFKENLIYANPFSIITARGHNPEVIKKGVKLFIDMVLTSEEKKEMVENIKDVINFEKMGNFYKPEQLDDDTVIDIYLDEKGEYHPVSSKEFGEKMGLPVSGGAANPEHAKKMALANFVEKVFDNVGKLIENGQYSRVSLGFSDDDIRNVKAMIEFVEDELSRMYPEIHFVIYDTSEGGKRKLVIEKE